MNRAILYLTRKKGKSFTLLMLVFLISTFVTTSLALMYTTNQVSRFMRESVEAQIVIRQIPPQRFVQADEPTEVFTPLPLTEPIINQIMAMAGVGGYNADNHGLASGHGLIFTQGLASGEMDNMGDIRAVNDSALFADFSDGRLSLVEGRHIAPEDKNAVMVSQTLAEKNDLTIGDTVALRPAEIGVNEAGQVENIADDSVPSINVAIIGIYAIETVQLDFTQPAAGIASNQMFTDHHTMVSLGLSYQGEYEMATFRMQDPSALPRVVSEIRQMDGLDWDFFFMQHNDGDYMRIAGDLQTVQNLLMTLLVAIGIVSITILTLILILRMRGRVHEVGILLSVGIGKKQIWGGFLLEVAIIAILSFVGSYIGSILITPMLNQGLLAGVPSISDLGQYHFQSMSPVMYALVYLLILVIILGTAYISTRMTIRLKPKQILSKMS